MWYADMALAAAAAVINLPIREQPVRQAQPGNKTAHPHGQTVWLPSAMPAQPPAGCLRAVGMSSVSALHCAC